VPFSVTLTQSRYKALTTQSERAAARCASACACYSRFLEGLVDRYRRRLQVVVGIGVGCGTWTIDVYVQFTDALRTVARGGTVMDPEVVAKLLARRSHLPPVARLTDRERQVLALMAEGRSNSAIGQRLVITDRAVSKHCTSIFAKLDLPPCDDDNRRVLAVLAYLDS
jgi:DNA-binding CsgD family transcriptional regulator